MGSSWATTNCFGRIGAGGMGVVYAAEHIFLHRKEAVKVLPVDDDCPHALLSRFYRNCRFLPSFDTPTSSQPMMQEKNPSPRRERRPLLYLAMELVDGGDLEKHVRTHGPVPMEQHVAGSVRPPWRYRKPTTIT